MYLFGKRKIAKNSMITTAAAVSLSLFLSQQVLAEKPYTCAYEKDKGSIKYVHKGKSNSAPITNFTERFGNLLAFDCSEDFTIMVFERGIVRAGGGKRVISAGTMSVPHPTNPLLFKEGSVTEITEGTPVKAKVAWGDVAVVLLADKSILIFKGLKQDDGSFRVQSPVIEKLNISDCDINISGSIRDTKIELQSGSYRMALIVEGENKDEVKIEER